MPAQRSEPLAHIAVLVCRVREQFSQALLQRHTTRARLLPQDRYHLLLQLADQHLSLGRSRLIAVMLSVVIGLQRRFGALATEQQARIQILPLIDLEALADALLDSQTSSDLSA